MDAMTETASWQPTTIWSKPESERAGTPLLVMFHGYGANEQDLMGIASQLPEEFTVVSVRAPQPMGPGFTWFPLVHDPEFSLEKVKKTVGDVWHWLDGVRGIHSSVTLLGFSMGMAVATSLLRHRPGDFAAVVGLSGFAMDAQGDSWFNDAAVKENKIPVFWGRDQEDTVITPDKVEYTHSWLTSHTKLTKVLYAGMWHGISAQELAHVKEFLTLTVLAPAK